MRVWVRIDNADRATLFAPKGSGYGPASHNVIQCVAESNVEELMANRLPLTRAAVNVMFQGFGFGTCPYFHDDGELRLE